MSVKPFQLDRLRSLRESLFLTREGLAAVIGVSHKTIERWERGQNKPRMRDMKLLADFFSDATKPTQPAGKKPSKVA